MTSDRLPHQVPALKGVRPSKLPPLLMLQLKRFTFDFATLRRKKLNHRVAFPLCLNLGPYVAEPPIPPEAVKHVAGAVGGGGGSGGAGAGAAAVDAAAADAAAADAAVGAAVGAAPAADEEVWYDCVGALMHAGSAQGGHYTALLRRGTGSSWHEFNDTNVTAATEADVESAAGHGEPCPAGGGLDSGRNAYLLVYRRRPPGSTSPWEGGEVCPRPRTASDDF